MSPGYGHTETHRIRRRHPDPYLKSRPLAPSHHFRRPPNDPENGPAHVQKQANGQRPTETRGPARHSPRPSAHARPDPEFPRPPVRDLDAAVPPRPLSGFLRWRGCTGWRLCCRWASSVACSASWATPSTTSTGPRTAGCAPILPLPILHARIPPRADSRFPPLSLWVQPKHIGNDMWDVAMERRDKKLVERPSGN
jgi:hypothetical protein